jgi:uncharacterized protein YaiI (UPF0178 family)/acetyl esterase/lipase
MKILVDADACPVKDIIVAIAKEYGLEVIMLTDTSHVLRQDYARVQVIGQGKDAVDFALVNQAEEGDLVVTQDYGVAAMVLGRKALALHPNGMQYTPENMDRLLFERHLSRKVRRSGGRIPHVRKRSKADDERFAKTFRSLCATAMISSRRTGQSCEATDGQVKPVRNKRKGESKMNNSKTQENSKILLWPDGAPGAMGTSPEDCPHIIPFLVDSPKARGLVVVCPGGGYGMRAPHEGDPIAQWLNGLGISAVVLHYRVAPYMHPYPLLDAQRAIRLVRYHASDWNVDPRHIGILGFSAGGHLASTAGTHYDLGDEYAPDPIDRISCRPDAMILCYPVISFGKWRHHGSMVNLLGENPDEELRQNLSNETRVTEDTPPAFLWHTADDEAVPVENSLAFASALSRHKVPFALHIYPHGRHGLGMAEEDPQARTWTDLCGKWLIQLGF